LLLVHKDVGSKQIILPFGLKNYKYVDESLKMIGITNYRFLKKGFYYYIRKLIFPVHLAPTGNYNDDIMKKLRQVFTDGINEEPGLKVYISRRKSSRRKIANEVDILPLLRQTGFVEVFCEDLSFKEQVILFSKVKYLVANHGAGMSNMLFMAEGSSVLELRALGDYSSNCYFSLASALNLKYYYQLCSRVGSDKDFHNADLVVEIEKLQNNLQILYTKSDIPSEI
jgi:capsular polysaccharide biosynthesis protein